MKKEIENTDLTSNNAKPMLGGFFSVLEKKPPLNKALLVASYFDPNKTIVRYTVAQYNGHFFSDGKCEVLNVGFWAELLNIETINEQDYQKWQREKLKEDAIFWIKRFLKFKDEFYNSLEFEEMEESDYGNDDYYIKKFLEQYPF